MFEETLSWNYIFFFSPTAESIKYPVVDQSKEENELKKSLQTEIEYVHKIKDDTITEGKKMDSMLEGNYFPDLKYLLI